MSRIPCSKPDKTNQYLTSLQTNYREVDIEVKGMPGIDNEICPSNPYRVMLSFGHAPSNTVEVYFVTGQGTRVLYLHTKDPFNITVTQQLHFLLPTYQWIIAPVNAELFQGLAIVKT